MRKYLLSSVLGICATAVLFFAFKSAEKENKGTQYILVEIYEIPSYIDKGVHIHYGGGKTEVIPFKEFKIENHDENGEITLNALNKLTASGYEIVSATSGMTQAGMITKVFMKK
ncbi:MAG: hypothetical protein ACJ75J_12540 [Cytophagaceae bacterium]|jgi:hypothetical protein